MAMNELKKSINKDKLVKLLNLSFSENDNEALSAIRMANAIVKESGVLWNEILAMGKTEIPKNANSYTKKVYWYDGKRVFNDLYKKGQWNDFVESVFNQFMNNNCMLTQKQINSILRLHRNCCGY